MPPSRPLREGAFLVLSLLALTIGGIVGWWAGSEIVAPPRGPGSIVVVFAKLVACAALGAGLNTTIALVVARVSLRRAFLVQAAIAALLILTGVASWIVGGTWR